jgi:lipopolysaccharide biosynthesis glycosyltransferase
MVTSDLYDEYKPYLELVYDKVIKISYIDTKKHKLTSKKHKEIYNNWYHISYTKWECLNLTEYSKICFVDSDLIILKNIDHLFELDAPAACFVNYWSEFGITKRNYYRNIKYGKTIPNEIVKNALHNSFVLVAHCVILEPNKDEYNNYKKFIIDEFTPSKKCISMFDEQALAFFYLSLNKKWTQLHHVYNSIPWKMVITNIKKHKSELIFYKPYILHYFNKVKPWMSNRNEWYDINIWYEFYDKLIKSIPELNTIPPLNKIISYIEPDDNSDLIKSISNLKESCIMDKCMYCNLLYNIFENIGNINIKDQSKDQISEIQKINIRDLNNMEPDIIFNNDKEFNTLPTHYLFHTNSEQINLCMYI